MNSRVLFWNSRVPWQKGVVTGLSTLALGFGAMNLFWFLGNWDSEVPGLWDYRSATIGDGVLLPLLSGALVTEISKLSRARHEMLIAFSLTAAGSITGWLVVRSWLTDPLAGENWTQANGALNSAGTYHLIFLMGASGMFAALFGILALRLRVSSQDLLVMFLHSRNLGVIISCLIGFTGMAVLDNVGPSFSTSNLMSILSVVGGSALILIIATTVRRRSGVVDFNSDLWAIANAASILALSDVIVRRGAGAPGFAMVVALCVSIGAALDSRYRGDRFWAERIIPSAVILWAGMSLVGVIILDNAMLRTVLDLALIGATVLAGATISGYWKWGAGAFDNTSKPPIWSVRNVPIGRSISPVFVLVSAPVIWGALANLSSHNPGAFGRATAIFLGAAISLLGARMANVGVRYYGEFVVKQELVHNDAWMKWGVLIAFASGVLFSLFWVVAQDMLGNAGQSADESHISFLWIVAGLSILTAAVAWAKTIPISSSLMARYRLSKHRRWLIAFVVTTVIWGLTPWMSRYWFAELSEFSEWTYPTIFRVLVALYLSVGFGFIVSRSVHQNGLRLHLLQSYRTQRIVRLSVWLSVSSMWFWLLGVAMWTISVLDHWRFFLIIGVVYLSTIVIGAAATHLTHQSTANPTILTVHDPWKNSIQDVALFGALVGFSYFAFRSLGAALENFSEAVQQVNTLLGFGFPLIIAYLYTHTLGNNHAHLRTMECELGKDEVSWTVDRGIVWTEDHKKGFLEELNTWIDQQNRVALFIAPTIPLMLLWKWSEENDGKQSFRHVSLAEVAIHNELEHNSWAQSSDEEKSLETSRP